MMRSEQQQNQQLYVDTTYSCKLLQNLSQCRENGQFTDINLKVNGTLFPCHKAVLVAGSEYFQNMFSSGMKEAQEDLIELKDVDSQCFQAIIHYLYSGTLDKSVTEPNAILQLLVLCDQFQIHGLMSLCKEYLINNIEYFSAELLYLLIISKSYSLKLLEERAFVELRNHIVENALNASKEVLLSLSEEQLVRILRDGNMKAENEDIFYRLLWKWVDAKKDIRQERFQYIMQHIRLPFCSPTFLSDVVCKDPLMASDECQTILQEALSFQKDINPQNVIASPQTIPRICYPQQHILMIQHVNERTEICNCEEVWLWKSTKDGSLMSPEMIGTFTEETFDRTYAAKYPYIIVCRKSSVITRKISDLSESGEKAMMNVTRIGHCVVIANDCLFIIGGIEKGSSNYHKTCECFELVQEENMGQITLKKVEDPPDMPLALGKPCVAAFQNKVFLFGGYSKHDIDPKRTFEYDIVKRQWTEKAKVPESDNHLSSVDSKCLKISESIYIIGVGIYLCYTPSQDVWREIPKPSENHHWGNAVAWNGKILLIGGSNLKLNGIDTVPTDTIEEYDPKTDSWSIYKLKLPQSLMCDWGDRATMFNMSDML